MKVWVPTNNEQNLATHKPQPPAMAATKPPAAIINIPETDSSPSNVQEAATTIETSSQAKATSQTKTVQAKTTTSQVKTTSQAKTVSQTKATASQAKTVTHYLLQVASLQNHHEVDQLKAQLLLMGYNVVVKTTQSNHKTLNRVWVGPYTSSAEAAKVKQILAQQHLKSILVKKND
jgi:cell division protein FtsN